LYFFWQAAINTYDCSNKSRLGDQFCKSHSCTSTVLSNRLWNSARSAPSRVSRAIHLKAYMYSCLEHAFERFLFCALQMWILLLLSLSSLLQWA